VPDDPGAGDDPGTGATTPAGTVVVVRDDADALEVLLVHRNVGIAFGDTWVFPGGQVEPADLAAAGTDLGAAARLAAARELAEETALTVLPQDLVALWRWPSQTPTGRRYSIWYFLAVAPPGADITVDGSELTGFQWIAPAEAGRLADTGRLSVPPATRAALQRLRSLPDTAAAMGRFRPPRG